MADTIDGDPNMKPFDEVKAFDPNGDVFLRFQKSSEIKPSAPNKLTFAPESKESAAPDLAPEPNPALDNTPNTYFQVSSRHLILASPVFGVMLDPNKFAEGKMLSAQRSLTINLPDDREAMEILMHIIHGMTRKVPRVVDLVMLTKLARLIDYYKIHESVEIFSKMWMLGLKAKEFPASYSPSVVFWLSISWVFQDSDAFSKMGLILIRECDSKSIDAIYQEDIPLPVSIIGSIQEKRARAIGHIVTVVHQQIQKYLNPKRICIEGPDHEECDAKLLGSLLKSSAAIRIWPRPQAPYHDLKFNILASQVRKMQILEQCRRQQGYAHFDHRVRSTIESSIGTAERQLQVFTLAPFLPAR